MKLHLKETPDQTLLTGRFKTKLDRWWQVVFMFMS